MSSELWDRCKTGDIRMSSEPPTYVEFKTIQAAIVGGYPGTYESFHRGQTQHQQLFYSWPGRGDKRTERIEANYRLDGRKFNRTQLNEHKSKCKGGKSWPRREHGPKKTVVKCAPKPSDPLSSKTFPTDLLKHQEELRSWVPKEGEITGKDNLLFSYMDFGNKATGG